MTQAISLGIKFGYSPGKVQTCNKPANLRANTSEFLSTLLALTSHCSGTVLALKTQVRESAGFLSSSQKLRVYATLPVNFGQILTDLTDRLMFDLSGIQTNSKDGIAPLSKAWRGIIDRRPPELRKGPGKERPAIRSTA